MISLQSQRVSDAGLARSTASPTPTTNAAEIERWYSRTSQGVTGTVRARFPAHVRGAGIRDLEEFSQPAAFLIATPLQLLGSVRGPNANPRRFWPTGISRKVDRRRVASPGCASRTSSPIETFPTHACQTLPSA